MKTIEPIDLSPGRYIVDVLQDYNDRVHDFNENIKEMNRLVEFLGDMQQTNGTIGDVVKKCLDTVEFDAPKIPGRYWFDHESLVIRKCEGE